MKHFIFLLFFGFLAFVADAQRGYGFPAQDLRNPPDTGMIMITNPWPVGAKTVAAFWQYKSLIPGWGGGGSVDLTGIRDSLDYLYGQTAQPDTAQVVIYKPAHGQNPALCPGGILPLTENFDAATAANAEDLPYTYAIGTRGPDSLVIKASGFYTSTAHGLTIGQVYYQQDSPCDLETTPGTISAAVLLVIDANTIQLIDRSGLPGSDAVRIWIPSSQFTSRGDDPAAPRDSTVGAIALQYQSVGLARPGAIFVYQLPAGTNNPTYTAASGESSTPARAWFWDGTRATRIADAAIAVDMSATSVGGRALIPASNGTAAEAIQYIADNYENLNLPNGTVLYWKGSGSDINPDTAYVVVDNPTVVGGQRVMLVKSLSTGGGGNSIVYDNYRLPAIHEYFPATGLNANESVANYSFSSVNPTFYKFSPTPLGTGSNEYGGWLANGTSGDSIAISTPFGVIIGDSQAEGHPARHGRLHPNGVATFSVNYQDSIGTISYTLRQLTNMRWFNHGIGSQTTDQVWARWRRDVLAENFDPGDGRGAKTLQRKPQFVIIIAGINDFYVYNRSWVSTAANLELMVQSARDNGIVPVVLNCPGDEIISLTQAKKIDSLNTWISSGALQAFGAAVIDYNTWWRDSSYNDNAHGNSLLADFIHPSEIGYDTLANIIFRAAKLPVLSGIKFTNQLSPLGFSGYSRPSSITIQGESYTISSDEELVTFSTPMAWDSVWVKIQSSTNVTGTTYSGFSHIQWLYSNDTTGVVTKRNELYQGYQGSSASIWGLSGSVISPVNTANRLAVGTASAPAATTVFTVQGTTTDATINSQWQSSAGLNPIVFTNNGRVGINRSSAIHNLHVGGTMMSETAAGYSFWNGPTSQMFAFQPRIQMQSTGVNTGGTGRTDADISFDGSNFVFAPASSASGANVKYVFRNKLSTYLFVVDVNTNRLGNVVTPAYGVDFSGARDGLVLASGTTAQRGSTGGVLYGLRMNTDSSQVEITPASATWHYVPRSAYPVKTTGLTGWAAGGLLTGVEVGSGLSLSGGTLSAELPATSRAEISATATRHYTLATAATNYTIDTLSSAFLTDFTYSAGVLTYTGTPTKRFLISYSLSIATDDSVLLSAGVDKNGAGPLTSTRQAASIGTNAGHVATANISGTGIVGLATNDTLKIVIQSDGAGAPIASVLFASLTVTAID